MVVELKQPSVDFSDHKQLLTYESVPEDRSWANTGLVSKVVSGDSTLFFNKGLRTQDSMMLLLSRWVVIVCFFIVPDK